MKISSVRSHLLSYPFPQSIELKYYGGTRKIVKRDAMLIRVETENGLVGYAPGEGSEKAHQAITDLIGPFLVGRVLAHDGLSLIALTVRLFIAVSRGACQKVAL